MSGEDWISLLRVRAGKLGLSSMLICRGGKAPEDVQANRAFHQGLLDELAADARAEGWPGAAFDLYRRREGWVAIQIVPAEGGALSLDGLKAFRDEQKRVAELTPPAPRQGALF